MPDCPNCDALVAELGALKEAAQRVHDTAARVNNMATRWIVETLDAALNPTPERSDP